MKNAKKNIVSCAAVALLSGSLSAFAAPVQQGSIHLQGYETEQELAKLAKVSFDQAIVIARKNLSEMVIEAELDDEDSSLIWEVKVVTLQGQIKNITIDGGNGKVLAFGLDDDEIEDRNGQVDGLSQ
jgi:uncharacterized membrane protein YkoI